MTNVVHNYDNGAYLNGDDEPPNYYDAILIKNRVASLINAKLNNQNQNDEITLNEVTLVRSSNTDSSEITAENIDSTDDAEETNNAIDDVQSCRSQSSSNSSDSIRSRVESSSGDQSHNLDEEATLNDAVISISLNRSDSTIISNHLNFSRDSLDESLRPQTSEA